MIPARPALLSDPTQTTATRRPRHLPAWLVAAVVTAMLAAMTWQAVARIPAVVEPSPLLVWSDCSGAVREGE